MAKTPCGLVVQPTVDNSAQPCDNPQSTNCIISEDALPFLGTGSGAPLTEVIEKLIVKIQRQDKLIKKLTKLNS